MASSFLKKKAKEQAEELEKKYGSSAYGGTTWLNDQLGVKGSSKDDDIAPVKPNQSNTEKDTRTWFQKGAFEDGYQFGDLTKTILGTGVDAGEDATTGVVGIGEKIVDFFAGIAPYVTQGMYYANGGGYNVQADQAFRQAVDVSKAGTEEFIKKDLYDEEKIAKAIVSGSASAQALKAWGTDSEEASVLGEKSDSLVQSAGQMGAQLALNAVAPGSGMAMMGMTAFGSEAENALNQGANLDEAVFSGAISAGAEILSEKLGGISFGGKTLTDVAFQNLSRHMTGKMAKILLTTGKLTADATSEGLEEIFSGWMGAVGQKLSYMEDKEIEELFSKDDALESFLGGFILGGAGGTGGVIKATTQGKDYVTGMTKNEQTVVNKLYEDAVAEESKNGKVTEKRKSELYDSIVEQMDKGYISTDAIESILGGETYKSYTDTVKSEDSLVEQEKTLTEEFNKLNRKPWRDMTGEEHDRLDELKEQLPKLREQIKANEKTGKRKQLKSQLSTEVSELVKGDRLVESYNEKIRMSQSFIPEYDKYKGTKHEDAAKKTIKSAIKAGANNSNRVRDLVEMAAQASADTGLTFEFKSGADIKKDFIARQTAEIAKLEAMERTAEQDQKLQKLKDTLAKVESGEVVVNGDISGGNVVLNLDSHKPLNRVVGHEITHSLEPGKGQNTKEYTALKDSLFAYAKTKGIDVDAKLKSIADQYEGVTDANPEAELVADLVGDFLFTDSKYIQRLSTENRNLFQRLWDEVKYLCKIATAGSQEARELARVQKAFEDAYRENGSQSVEKNSENTKYSLEKQSKSKYNKRSRYSETETLFLSWENGSAPVGEVKKFVRYGKTHYYEKTENGCVELSRSQYNERNGAYVENIDRRAEREAGETYDYDASTQRGTLGHPYGNRDTRGTAAVFGQTFREELQHDTAGSVSGTLGHDSRTGIKQSEYRAEASDDSDASFVTFSNDYATIRNAMKDGDVSKDSRAKYSLSEDSKQKEELEQLRDKYEQLMESADQHWFGLFGEWLNPESEDSTASYIRDIVIQSESSRSSGGRKLLELADSIDRVNSQIAELSDRINSQAVTNHKVDFVEDQDAPFHLENTAKVIEPNYRPSNADIKADFDDMLSWMRRSGNKDTATTMEEYAKANGVDAVVEEMLADWGTEYSSDSTIHKMIDSIQAELKDELREDYEWDGDEALFNRVKGVVGEVLADTKYSLSDSDGKQLTEEQNEQGLERKQEVQYSLSRDTEFSDKAITTNDSSLRVSQAVMDEAKAVRERIAARMKEIKAKGLVGLPADIEGNTYIANSSYDGTEENTTICPRSLASEAFVDAVSEYLGRPLTVEEQIYISQDLQGRSMTPECTYCYVATDRKAYRAFLGEYINQRDSVLQKLKENPTADISRSGELYKEFLGGRKDTNPMYSRFKMWVDAYKTGTPLVEASNLANLSKLMGDINSEFGEELKPQIVDAMKYAQSASWAKKRVNYVAYNGHILKWKQDRINKLNSHYGLRMYSFSDFHPAFVLENMQMITDASVRGLKMLGYTKDTDFVDIFAPSGMNINVSTFGFESGGNVYENNIIGANWDKAKALRAQYPNVGVTFVATNDTLVNWALEQDWIDVVIPYHLVRTGAEVAKAFNYTNYTSESSDVKDTGWKKGDKKYIAPTEHNNDKATYLAALEKNHLKPRFARFLDNPNYMKLVNECRQSASMSKPVQPIFNEEAANEALSKLEANGYYQPIGGSVDRMYEIAAEVADNMIAPTQNSLSYKGEDIAPMGDFDVYGSDFGVVEGDDGFAPVAENASADNAKVAQTEATMLPDDIAPVADTESDAPVTDEERNIRLEREKATLDKEFQKRRAELQELLKDKNAFVSNRASELYNEIRNLKKGVKASEQLGSLLDTGYEWSAIRSALVNIKYTPGERVNMNSPIESIARQMLSEEYEDLQYELDDLDSEHQKRIKELEKNASASPRTTRKELHSNIVENIRSAFSRRGFDFDEVLEKAKNLSTFATVDNTPQRVMEKSLGYKEGQILSDMTVNQVAQNETEKIKWLNSFTDRKSGLLAQISKQYNIKPGSKESAAAQMYAEGFYVNENNEIVQYGDAELSADFKDAQVQRNIKGLASDPRIRQIYDDTLAMINESRARNLYPEIPRLDNYFLHFRAMDDTFSRLGLPFNPNDIKAKDLPTDLNGVTADLKPGQPYFASAKHRMGKRTSFDLLGGLERYLTSAGNQIYHIDDIQTLRALRNYIADTYGQANGLEGLDELSEEEAQERIKQVYGSHLSTFAKFLNEEANIIAGKTALIDRGLEGIIGRRGITFLDSVNKQVGSNMVGYNISSSLTNFLPVAQTFAKSNKFDFVKAFAQTVSNKVQSVYGKGDDFAENSPVVIRRKGADRFYRTPWQKLSDPGYALMGIVDDISTELIARTKYNELTRNGMDSQQAHLETDKWVSRLMGDRSMGQMPQIYNSKMLGLITKFQLEVRNQLDSQFYDTIQEAKVSNEDIESGLARNAKIAAKVGSTFVQLAVVQHLFGKAFESVAGYNPAFDIIETIITAFGWDDEEEEPVLDNLEEAFLGLLEDLPYTSTFTGGRIPISNALPIKELFTGKDEYGNEKSRLETLGEAAPYYILPGGYGQIKKTVQGLGMFSEDHPISGSYTDSGKLRFPVEDTFGNRLQAGIFGQYASKNARDYFDNGRSPLAEKQIEEFMSSGMKIQDYWGYREGLSGLSKLSEKADYIDSLDLTDEQKNLFINNIADRKEDIDMSTYGDYDSFEEFDYATKNPEKYDFLTKIGVSYKDYASADDDTKDAYDWAFKNPEKFTLSKAVAGDVVTYRQYTGDLYDIKADKDSSGKSITGSRKEKVLDYINNMDADYGAKIILFKSEYPADDTYNNDIIDYLNGREDISYEEMETILKELGFTVDSSGNISWD